MNEALINAMLKTLGVDPAEVKARITENAKKAMQAIDDINRRLILIESKLDMALGARNIYSTPPLLNGGEHDPEKSKSP
jgi:hypothetical protein